MNSKATNVLTVLLVSLILSTVYSENNSQKPNDDEMLEYILHAKVLNGDYSIKKFSKFAQSMIDLESNERIDKLTKICHACDRQKNPINGIIMCQLLFAPERPLLGGACWIGDDSTRLRIVEPIVFVNSTPILGVYGYRLGGVQQSSVEYLQRCLKSRVLLQDYESPDDDQILRDLNWYLDFIKIPTRDFEQKRFLLKQANEEDIP